ncbi:VRR-NUC domain-containing protein [Aerococcus mictus]|uniref:VRR-NUC domain-containing protein n=1 Tax=Aerococcus mictus TaxID=2976810 RepID=UPI002DDC826E|nr:VRR-NUC domain-containing protein [Aerococcus mictus]
METLSQSEKVIENKIKKYLDSLGAYYEKIHGESLFQSAGIPDILACVNGHFVGIEVKREKGNTTSALQDYKLKAITNAGGVAIVARSVQDVQECLQREGIV